MPAKSNEHSGKPDERGSKPEARECFVIMPISDPDGYAQGHFQHVYQDIFKPAIEQAGNTPFRADDDPRTNFIHLAMLKRLLRAPVALCDLSARNPNVMFELGLRQAFNMPVVLVQEVGTPQIFDIGPLRYTEYRRDMLYREVLEDRDRIATAISSTIDSWDPDDINSLVRLLSLTEGAKLPETKGADPWQQYFVAALGNLNSQIAAVRGAIATQDFYARQATYIREPVSVQNIGRELAAALAGMLNKVIEADPQIAGAGGHPSAFRGVYGLTESEINFWRYWPPRGDAEALIDMATRSGLSAGRFVEMIDSLVRKLQAGPVDRPLVSPPVSPSPSPADDEHD